MNLDTQVSPDCVVSPEHQDLLDRREILAALVLMVLLESRAPPAEMAQVGFRV